jgi:DNA-3-methyladenine glycosylase
MALFNEVNCPAPEWLRSQFLLGRSGLTSNRACEAFPREVVMSIRPFQEQIAGLGAVALAQRLIGASLLVRGAGGIIIETEAYGQDDPASHSFHGPTQRNASMFGPTGHAYVYRSYGIHLCLNVVAGPGEAVLIRALTPQVGLDLMQMRRGSTLLCSGPGRLTQALGLRPDDDGASFDAIDFSITLPSTTAELLVGPRIGISKAKDLPWRFGLAGAGGLSRPFPPQML